MNKKTKEAINTFLFMIGAIILSVILLFIGLCLIYYLVTDKM